MIQEIILSLIIFLILAEIFHFYINLSEKSEEKDIVHPI